MKRRRLEGGKPEEHTPKSPEKSRSLHSIFGAPPLSVLDPKQKYWKVKKKEWLSKGIQSEVGRGDNALGLSDLLRRKQTGTSVFDPFLCELVVRWYSRPGDLVFDPFAGGSVRGVVVSTLGRLYVGHEIRQAQVDANYTQIGLTPRPELVEWVCGDSARLDAPTCQLVFTCPPYMDMEKYSDMPDELSTMREDAFFAAYEAILMRAAAKLEPECFFVIMVGNVRRNGVLARFPERTVDILVAAGLSYHNELVYLQEPATAAMRAFNAMNISRVAGSVHQKLLVFCKGSAKDAATRLGKFQE